MTDRRTMTLAAFQQACRDQGMPSPMDLAVVCPACGTVQSARDLIAAGAGADFEEVRKKLGFSCVGRYTGAPSPRPVPDGQPCDWTLGGLFQIHTLEVIADDGKAYPIFELATPEQAQRHLKAQSLSAAVGGEA